MQVIASDNFLVQLGLTMSFSTSTFLDTIRVRGQGLSGLVKSAINSLFTVDYKSSIMVGAAGWPILVVIR
jgi:hypothetical protein